MSLQRAALILAGCLGCGGSLIAGAEEVLAVPATPPQAANAMTDTATGAAPLAPEVAAMEARNWHVRTGAALQRDWGVDVRGVTLAQAGWMLTFRYRILDPERAKVLLNAKSTAYLVDQSSGARLAVPAMENIGELRQVGHADAQRGYYIMFGNANRIVQRGSKVDVVIGDFHAEGMVVQ